MAISQAVLDKMEELREARHDYRQLQRRRLVVVNKRDLLVAEFQALGVAMAAKDAEVDVLKTELKALL